MKYRPSGNPILRWWEGIDTAIAYKELAICFLDKAHVTEMKLNSILSQSIDTSLLKRNGLKKKFNCLYKNGWIRDSQPFLSATQIYVWWTPRDLGFNQRMKK